MDNLQHWLGDFARLFTLQFTSNKGMSDDNTLCECDVEIDHSTRTPTLYEESVGS